MSKTIYIGGRLESKEKSNVVTGANAILDDTKGKKQNVINKETDDELLRLEQSKQDNLNFDNTPTEDSTNPVTSGGVYTAEKALSDAIEAILLLIPSAATALNKLVDTNTMNSSISTATATFRGTYNAVSDLGLTYQATHAQIEAALDALGLTADNNDFVFVQIPVSDQSQDIAKTERFKFNGTNWLYEYDLNTSGFTAAQWAAINSGITVALVTKLTDLPTAAALQLALNAKQDTLTFDNEPTALSQNPVTSGGIYLAIQAVATALSNYSDTTDNRLNTLEGLVPTEASSSNKLTDKAYVDGLIQAITELIPAEADTTNQLADKAYVLAQILAATPAFKGQFTTLAELQAVASPKAGDLGIVRTKDSDGMDVFTVYQYLSNAWNVFYSLSYHPQTKPATTGTTGDYPYNGMGRVELVKNMVNTGTELAPTMVNQLTQDMFYKGAVGSRVPNTNTIFVIRYDYVLGEDITIPDGCVLEFDGGSISGAYTLTGANTAIKAGLVKIFDTTTTIAGTWNVAEAYPEWFGAKGDGVTDDVFALQKTLYWCATICNSIVRLSNKYLITTTLYIPASVSIIGNIGNYYYHKPSIIANLIDKYSFAVMSDVYTENDERFKWSYDYTKITSHWNNTAQCSIKNIVIETTNETFAGLFLCNVTTATFENIDIIGFKLGMQTCNVWACTFSSISLDAAYIGFIIGTDSTSNVYNNLQIVRRTDVEITATDEAWYVEHVQPAVAAVFDNENITTNYKKSTAIVCNFGSGTFNNCGMERFDAGLMAVHLIGVFNCFYVEGLEDFIIACDQSDIMVNQMYGTQTFDPAVYNYIACSLSNRLELHGCHPGRYWSPFSEAYNLQYYNMHIYHVYPDSFNRRNSSDVIGNNNNTTVKYYEHPVVYVNDGETGLDNRRLGYYFATAVSFDTFIDRWNNTHIYDDVDIVSLQGDCTLTTCTLGNGDTKHKELQIDLNGHTLTLSTSLILDCNLIVRGSGTIAMGSESICFYGADDKTVKLNYVTVSNTGYVIMCSSMISIGYPDKIIMNLDHSTVVTASYFRNLGESLCPVEFECRINGTLQQ